MTELPNWAFGRAGPLLETNGFSILPISIPDPSNPDLGKKPPAALLNWAVPTPAAVRLLRYAGCGVGVLTANTPAVDIDVRDQALADAIERMVVGEIGDGPVRYGQAPKRLRPCRTDRPFGKATTRGYRLPGDQPGDKLHKVEILGAGQQFVAYGIHPATGQPYAWPFDSLLDVERHDLPELSAESAERVVAQAEIMLARAGVQVAARARKSASAGLRLPGPTPRAVQNLGEARKVLTILGSIDPSRLDYDTWIATAYGVKAALGEHGRAVWIAWSRASARHDGSAGPAGTPERVWAGVKPERCGWRFLERLAGEIAGGDH